MNGLGNESGNCKICGTHLLLHQRLGPLEQRIRCQCPRCGQYTITDMAEFQIPDDMPNTAVAALSHVVRSIGRDRGEHEYPLVTKELVFDVLKNPAIPILPTQMENLVLWLGYKQPDHGTPLTLDDQQGQAIVGARSVDEFCFVLGETHKKGLVYYKNVGTNESWDIQLTADGWIQFGELMKGRSDSRRAFMAMPFGDDRLDSVFQRFKEAVSQTGFELLRADDRPEAGSIDNRIRVEILTSRFLLAELTGDNNGVYWEAGFAEGLGKPVIYTCQQGHKTHFDTNHLQTVFWDDGDLAGADSRLKAAIRATFPADAKMTD